MNPHGTRQRFHQGCRCESCRNAWNCYQASRARARRRGDWQGLVRTKAARSHIEKLGASNRVIAVAAGVSASVIDRIRTGKKILVRSRDAVLAVRQQDIANAYPLLSAGAFIPADETKRLLADLESAGFNRCELGRKVGLTELRIEKPRVRLWNAKRVERIYRKIGTKAA